MKFCHTSGLGSAWVNPGAGNTESPSARKTIKSCAPSACASARADSARRSTRVNSEMSWSKGALTTCSDQRIAQTENACTEKPENRLPDETVRHQQRRNGAP